MLETCHTVVDVGGVYDDGLKRYDHHQRGFEETFSPVHKTKLSSAGLVYKHFGREIVARQTQLPAESEEGELLFQKMYEDLIDIFPPSRFTAPTPRIAYLPRTKTIHQSCRGRQGTTTSILTPFRLG